MNLTANRKSLLKAIKTAIKSVSKLKEIPELNGILLEADAESGVISATGTNAITQVQSRLLNEHVLESGSIIVMPIIADILKLLSGDTVELTIGFDNTLEIKSGQSQYNIPFFDSNKFPKMTIPFPEDFICIKNINSLIKKTTFATEDNVTDISKKSLEFVKLSFADGKTYAEATNGKIAALSQSPHTSDGNLNIILHESALNILTNIVTADEELYVGIAGKFAVFMKEDMFFSTMLYDGHYIEGSKLVEYVKPIYKATVNSKDFTDIISNVTTILSTTDDQCINLCVFDNKVVVKSKTATGASQIEIAATDTAPTNEIGFNYNPKWLMDCLKQATGPLTLLLDSQGFMIIEANQSRYCISPRRSVQIKVPKQKPEKKVKSKTSNKNKTVVAAAA